MPDVYKNETNNEWKSNTTATLSQKNITSANTNKPRIGDSVLLIRTRFRQKAEIKASASITNIANTTWSYQWWVALPYDGLLLMLMAHLLYSYIDYSKQGVAYYGAPVF